MQTLPIISPNPPPPPAPPLGVRGTGAGCGSSPRLQSQTTKHNGSQECGSYVPWGLIRGTPELGLQESQEDLGHCSVHIRVPRRVLFSQKEEESPAVCNNTDEP